MLYHLRQDNIWCTFWKVFCLTDDSGPDTDNPGVWIPESPLAGATSFRNDQKYVGYWSVKKNQYRIIPQQSKKLYGKSCLTSHNREIMPPFIVFYFRLTIVIIHWCPHGFCRPFLLESFYRGPSGGPFFNYWSF